MDWRQEGLRRLFWPESIVVVGASERPGPGRQVIENLVQLGFRGTIVPINPKYESVLGHRSYESVAQAYDELGQLDAAAILLGRDRILPVLRDLSKAGIRGAWAFASGFSEVGPEGTRLQSELAAFCQENEIAFCGPNCVGFVHPAATSAAFSAPISPALLPGNVAAVSQSGSITLALINSGRGIGFRAVVSSGNEAVLDCTDYIEYFVADPQTSVILAFVEQLRRPDQFIDVAEKARVAGKPLIVLKVGRSEIARRATIAHTGALAGSDAVYDVVFRKHGVIRVDDLDEMLETAEAFSCLKGDLPQGNRVGMLTVSGGEISLIGDLASDLDLTFPEWSERTRGRLADELPDYAEISNPLDAWGSGRIEETYARCVDAIVEEDVDLVMISQDAPQGMARSQIDQYATVARAVAAARLRTSKPILAFSHLSGGLDATLHRMFDEGGVPFLQGTRRGLLVARHLMDFAEARRQPPKRDSVASSGRQIALRDEDSGVLDEIESKRILRDYGIPCVREILCSTSQEAVDAAREIGGPIVLKAVSRALPHKTDAGVVALGLETESEIRGAFDEILARAVRAVPREAVRGIVVQQMVSDIVAEVIVGATNDPTFGPTLVFGLGGIAVELLHDRSLGLAPLDPQDALEMIEATKARSLLSGFRGRPLGDLEALAHALVCLGDLAATLGNRLISVDVNPLLVLPHGQGVVAVDGLIELADRTPSPGNIAETEQMENR